MGAAIALLLAAPFLAIFAAFFRAAILFWPTMVMLGVAHNTPGLEMVPALGWDQTFVIIVLISLLFGGLSSTSSSSKG